MVSEFEFIKHIKSRYSLDKVGDDCAVLPKDSETDLLITTDLLIEDIDFRLDWTTPELLGQKALGVSLSDIAAMGGRPTSALISIGVPADRWESDLLDRFYEGWHAVAGQYGVELIGGDVSRSPETLVIDSIVLGEVPTGKALLRSTAKPGDAIYVSGYLGGAAAGLKLFENGCRIDMDDRVEDTRLLMRHLNVYPELSLANYLIQQDIATAAIDVSDGLSSDLQHICDMSGVGARIDFESLPFHPDLEGNFPAIERENLGLHGGEDFILLFTTGRKDITWPANVTVTRIGEVTSETGQIELIRNGSSEVLMPQGFQHF